MLRRILFIGGQKYGGRLSPFFLVFGILLLIALPIFNSKKMTVDENAVGHMMPNGAMRSVEGFLNSTVKWPQRLVRGRRSPGSEIIAVYVNSEFPASVSVANALIEVVRTNDILSCDIQFYFVNSTQPWPIPRSYARSALILNFSSFSSSHLCIDTLGANGVQPNQDLAIVAVKHAVSFSMSVSFLCQKPDVPVENDRSRFWHYWSYLENSVQLSQYRQKWHTIPTYGINTIAFSTDHRQPDDAKWPSSSRVSVYVGTLYRTILSLNGLDEKFHHSSFVWLPTSIRTYVDYDTAQFCTILFVSSIYSTAYANYQGVGVTISPVFAGLLVAPFGVSAAFNAVGWPGVIAASAFFVLISCRILGRSNSSAWICFNAIALCLQIVLQPESGLLAGACAAIQLFFIHPLCCKPAIMAVGTVLSWGGYWFFVKHLHMSLCGTNGISDLFVSFVIYPNAIWLTARLLCMIF